MANILLVEDDTTFATILENFLKKKGFDVVVKYSVKSGIEALKTQEFQLILLDYRLGNVIGIEVREWIRAQDRVIPYIIMTSFNDIRTAVNAIRQGVFDNITKPVNPDEILMVVNEARASKSADKANTSSQGRKG